MCVSLTPVFLLIVTVIIEIYLQCFTESVSLREIGEPISRVELSSPNSLQFRAVEGTHLVSALTGAASELKINNRKKNSHKIHYSPLRKKT